MIFFFELHRKGKAKTYGNVTFKLQIQTEKKKLGNAKVMVVIAILAKSQLQVYFLKLIYTIESFILHIIAYILMLHGVWFLLAYAFI